MSATAGAAQLANQEDLPFSSFSKTTTAVITTMEDGLHQKCLCQLVAKTSDNEPEDGNDNHQDGLPWDHSVVCSTCCQNALRPHWERHEHALREREEARKGCAQKLHDLRNRSTNTYGTSTGNLSELEFESQRLRDRRTRLQQQCATLAVEVAACAVENEERKAQLNPQAELHRQHLQRLDRSIGEGSMIKAIESAREQVRTLRFQWALKAFAMHRLDVHLDLEDVVDADEELGQGATAAATTTTTRNSPSQASRRQSLRSQEPRQARGIGKIAGLPLPNAGPELYGVLPPQELQSALRLVASLTSTVARCLGIHLPHPVLLHPSHSKNRGDIIRNALPIKRDQNNESTTAKEKNPASNSGDEENEDELDPTSTASLLSHLNFSLEDERPNRIDNHYYTQRNVSISNAGQPSQGTAGEHTANISVSPPSMDPSMVSRRLHHATAAILAEADFSGKNTVTSASSTTTTSSSSSTAAAVAVSSQYALAADQMYDDEFAVALQLLQNNILALCIRSGVPVDKLYPGQAVLMNLYSLQLFCEDQIKQYLV